MHFTHIALSYICTLQFPQWSKLVHLPLALKFWILKLVVQFAGERYLQWERDVLVGGLADLETQCIEQGLPVPVPLPAAEQEGPDRVESESSEYTNAGSREESMS